MIIPRLLNKESFSSKNIYFSTSFLVKIISFYSCGPKKVRGPDFWKHWTKRSKEYIIKSLIDDLSLGYAKIM
jgi:hypothetical protein